MVTNISVRATIAQLEVGEKVVIPLSLRKSNTVRNCASVLGTDLGRKYSVSFRRTTNDCEVSRLQ